MFHVASHKGNIYHYPHCTTGSDSWCNYSSGNITRKLSKDAELKKCLHDKTQNANESFNGTIRERIPKNTLVTLRNLEFGVYDAVAHFSIGMKASVLIYEKLNFAPGVYMLNSCKKGNLKRVNLANQRACSKNKLRQQILRAKKMSKNNNLLKKVIYMCLEDLEYIVVYLDVCHFNHWLF